MRLFAATALIAAATLACAGSATARTLHQAVTLRGSMVEFYAGHLVLDALGGAYLDDGTYHVSAERIILDLRANRYVAAGGVTVCTATCVQGTAFGTDLGKHRGLLVALVPTVSCSVVGPANAGPSVVGPANAGPGTGSVSPTTTPGTGCANPATIDPLRFPDTEGEQPFALSPSAVAHVGADVRLQAARVIVPSGRVFFFPSYVYTFSSDPGYVVSNVPGAGEDVPVYIGSTRNSILGLHFLYNPITKVALGIDEHIVNGPKSYALISEAPLIGPNKAVNFTWQEQINAHATQTFTASAAQGSGIFNSYDVRNSVHRSFFELTGSQFHQLYGGVLAWQGFDQQLAPTGLGSLLYFHLRSEYGAAHNPSAAPFFPFPPTAILPKTVAHGALEGYVATRPLALGADDTLSFSFDARQLRDTLPHTQVSEVYSANLSHRWNRHLTTGFAESITPIHDGFPTLGMGVYTRFSSQTGSLFYSNRDAFALSLNAVHSAGFSEPPTGLSIQPWFLTADVRFRVGRALSLDLSRTYNFNYFGRTWGGFGIQVLP